MAYNNIALNAVDLFCGAGGLSRGLEDSGINVQLGIELNPVAATTYRNNLHGDVIIDDIRNVSSIDIMNRLNIKPRHFTVPDTTVVTGNPIPCRAGHVPKVYDGCAV